MSKNDSMSAQEVIPADIALVLKRALVWCGMQITEHQRDAAFAWVDERDPSEEMGQ